MLVSLTEILRNTRDKRINKSQVWNKTISSFVYRQKTYFTYHYHRLEPPLLSQRASLHTTRQQSTCNDLQQYYYAPFTTCVSCTMVETTRSIQQQGMQLPNQLVHWCSSYRCVPSQWSIVQSCVKGCSLDSGIVTFTSTWLLESWWPVPAVRSLASSHTMALWLHLPLILDIHHCSSKAYRPFKQATCWYSLFHSCWRATYCNKVTFSDRRHGSAFVSA